jgi:hypothetical protein
MNTQYDGATYANNIEENKLKIRQAPQRYFWFVMKLFHSFTWTVITKYVEDVIYLFYLVMLKIAEIVWLRPLMKEWACSVGGMTIIKDRTELFAKTVVSSQCHFSTRYPLCNVAI